jgi:hypothetical protein
MNLAGRWRIVAGITVVVATLVMMPGYVGNNDVGDLLFWSYLLTALWFVALIFAVIRFKRRGLIVLIGAPIVLFWPIAFKLMEYACRHNVKACI